MNKIGFVASVILLVFGIYFTCSFITSPNNDPYAQVALWFSVPMVVMGFAGLFISLKK